MTEESKSQTFEQSLKRLGEIVDALERGDKPLEESLKLFEEGTKLARLAQERLDKAERRMDELLSVDGKGNAKTRSFRAEGDDTPDSDR